MVLIWASAARSPTVRSSPTAPARPSATPMCTPSASRTKSRPVTSTVADTTSSWGTGLLRENRPELLRDLVGLGAESLALHVVDPHGEEVGALRLPRRDVGRGQAGELHPGRLQRLLIRLLGLLQVLEVEAL